MRRLTRPTSAAVLPTFSQTRRPGFPGWALVITLPLEAVVRVTLLPVFKSRPIPISQCVFEKQEVDTHGAELRGRANDQVARGSLSEYRILT